METPEQQVPVRKVCCLCGRVQKGEAWLEPADGLPETGLTHGYCPACYLQSSRTMTKLLAAFRKRLPSSPEK